MTGVLVIKHGALGDVVLATGPFAAIRAHHPDQSITLLTTSAFAGVLASAPYFDSIWVDQKPPWWRVDQWLELARRLNGGRFQRVYDLQTSTRSSRYFRLMWPRPEWSGIARGCSHPDSDPARDHLHTVARQRGQLRAAGIEHVPEPDMSWLADTAIAPGQPYALLVPGGSAHRLDKRWPGFAILAEHLAAAGLMPVLVGGAAEAEALAAIQRAVPACLSLAGKTTLADLVSLGRHAAVAVGNDTGPMHLAAVAGAPSLVLFSHASDPALCQPVGRAVTILRRPSLQELGADEVVATALRLAGRQP
ncbi:MAG: lipopolysaccharide heptosyltransferase family protein [Alphaproteobacteria bacterium]|nr:MAG: lipopolysaccharide heptosyltransferase family protein [Alphaproteobacteria bacterium]